jgi:hypothetical protein
MLNQEIKEMDENKLKFLKALMALYFRIAFLKVIKVWL